MSLEEQERFLLYWGVPFAVVVLVGTFFLIWCFLGTNPFVAVYGVGRKYVRYVRRSFREHRRSRRNRGGVPQSLSSWLAAQPGPETTETSVATETSQNTQTTETSQPSPRSRPSQTSLASEPSNSRRKRSLKVRKRHTI